MATPPPAEPHPAPDYPPIQPTGSLLLAYQLPSPPSSPSAPSTSSPSSPSPPPPRPYAVLLLGAGPVAASRLYHLLCAGAPKVVLIAPRSGACEETLYRLAQCERGEEGIRTVVEWREREYAGESDLDTPEGEPDYAMVLTAIDSSGGAELSTTICRAARARKLPVNVADVPPECDFYFGSVLRRGALSVMVSTNGKGPRVAARVRRRLERALPETAGEAIERVGELRGELRKREGAGGKGKEVIERRMEWMSRVSDKWSLAQLGEMDERMRAEVLEGWETGEARGYWDVNRWRYAGAGWAMSLVDRVRWAVSPPSVDGDPDRTWGERPALVAAGGFVGGLVVGVGAALAVVGRRR
ncbi:hypothetical protein JCM6882_002946 [Rhodosporidiobolus microsporus]